MMSLESFTSPKRQLLSLSLALVALWGCGSTGGGGGGGGSGGGSGTGPGGASTSGNLAEKPCKTNADCPGAVCLSVGSASGCVVKCTATANACGGSAECGGVGALSLDVCQPKKDPMEAPKAEEQPRIPCTSDAECAASDPGTICASYRGVKDCTIPCTQESNCDLPALPNIKLDFLTCGTDVGQPARKACLPDEKCFANPSSCYSISGLPTGSTDGGCQGPANSCTSNGQCCSNMCMFGFCG